MPTLTPTQIDEALTEIAVDVAEHERCGEPIPRALTERREALEAAYHRITGQDWPPLPDFAPVRFRRVRA